jgi:nucleotide-binding universal stress UspA family protein
MKHLLVPLDFSDATERVAEAAAQLAAKLAARITLLHVAPPDPAFVGYEAGPQSVRDNVAKQLHEEHKRLQAVEKQCAQRGLSVTALLVQGFPSEKILSECERMQADLIVMGSHGHGMLRHLLVGSVTDGVLRKARCPVLVVPVAR